MIVERAARWLRSVNPGLPSDQTTSKVNATWFIRPERTVVQLAVALLALLLALSARLEGRVRPWLLGHGLGAAVGRRELDGWDYGGGALLAVQLAEVLYFKVRRGRMWFMLQPCNTFLVLLLFMQLSRTAAAAWMFNFYLHVMWGSWCVCGEGRGRGAGADAANGAGWGYWRRICATTTTLWS